MRVLRVNSVTMGIGASQEADWPGLAAAALLAVREGRERAPAVWFRTDQGASGLIPVFESDPTTFTDEERPARFMRTLIALGPEANPLA